MTTTADHGDDPHPVHIAAEPTNVRDEVALRKIARACIAIARRELGQLARAPKVAPERSILTPEEASRDA
jgi:hypothetical protein